MRKTAEMLEGTHKRNSEGWRRDMDYRPEELGEPEGSACNQVREESGLPINNPCQACGRGACIDR